MDIPVKFVFLVFLQLSYQGAHSAVLDWRLEWRRFSETGLESVLYPGSYKIARHPVANQLIVGKSNSGWAEFFGALNGISYVEAITDLGSPMNITRPGDKFLWVTGLPEDFPQSAIVGGYSASGEPVYVATIYLNAEGDVGASYLVSAGCAAYRYYGYKCSTQFQMLILVTKLKLLYSGYMLPGEATSPQNWDAKSCLNLTFESDSQSWQAVYEIRNPEDLQLISVINVRIGNTGEYCANIQVGCCADSLRCRLRSVSHYEANLYDCEFLCYTDNVSAIHINVVPHANLNLAICDVWYNGSL